jgi:hypothetical protein
LLACHVHEEVEGGKVMLDAVIVLINTNWKFELPHADCLHVGVCCAKVIMSLLSSFSTSPCLDETKIIFYH